MSEFILTQSTLKKIISYCRKTGSIIRKDRKNGNGSIDAYGYLIIKIKGHQYKAHRLAWLYEFGSFPAGVIDHINGDKLDNRISNLRDVAQSVNVKSTKRTPNKETGVVGIYIDKSTRGLIAKYTTKVDGITYRFRSLNDAVRFREVGQ